MVLRGLERCDVSQVGCGVAQKGASEIRKERIAEKGAAKLR
jgi:hypothetical protein